MTTVYLSQHTIMLSPPQRLLLLEVTSEKHGFCFRLFPAGGVEVTGMRLVSKTPVRPASAGADETEFAALNSSAMIHRLSEMFPQLTEIDLRNVPKGYSVSFGHVASPFSFESGERYFISGVGEHVWEITAVAK